MFPISKQENSRRTLLHEYINTKYESRLNLCLARNATPSAHMFGACRGGVARPHRTTPCRAWQHHGSPHLVPTGEPRQRSLAVRFLRTRPRSRGGASSQRPAEPEQYPSLLRFLLLLLPRNQWPPAKPSTVPRSLSPRGPLFRDAARPTSPPVPRMKHLPLEPPHCRCGLPFPKRGRVPAWAPRSPRVWSIPTTAGRWWRLSGRTRGLARSARP